MLIRFHKIHATCVRIPTYIEMKINYTARVDERDIRMHLHISDPFPADLIIVP